MSKRVAWDEKNLTENEDYRRLHPVTMKIDEPKTPYCPEAAVEEGSFDDEDECDETTWDPEVNAFVRKIKNEVPLLREEPPPAPLCDATSAAPSATTASSSTGKRARVSLAPVDVVQDGAERDHERKQHELEFRTMRRAVYADEGKHFKSAVESGDGDLDE